jgi:hypothetical protein
MSYKCPTPTPSTRLPSLKIYDVDETFLSLARHRVFQELAIYRPSQHMSSRLEYLNCSYPMQFCKALLQAFNSSVH